MKITTLLTIHSCTLAVGLGLSSAAIISVTDTVGSSEGVFASRLATAPLNVTNTGASNLAQQGFDEKQDVLWPAIAPPAISLPIPSGLLVDSHMIFLNRPVGHGSLINHDGAIWEFDGRIIAVMADGMGSDEAASSSLLGAAGNHIFSWLI